MPFQLIKKEVPCQWSAKYRSVMGKGIITIENDPVVKKHGIDLILKKYGAETELKYADTSISAMIILKLEIISATGKQ